MGGKDSTPEKGSYRRWVRGEGGSWWVWVRTIEVVHHFRFFFRFLFGSKITRKSLNFHFQIFSLETCKKSALSVTLLHASRTVGDDLKLNFVRRILFHFSFVMLAGRFRLRCEACKNGFLCGNIFFHSPHECWKLTTSRIRARFIQTNFRYYAWKVENSLWYVKKIMCE